MFYPWNECEIIYISSTLSLSSLPHYQAEFKYFEKGLLSNGGQSF